MSFVEHYRDYYDPANEPFRRWRRAGAVEKADNIVSLRTEATQFSTAGSIVDVGCGDGALAARLQELGFL